MEEQQAVEIRHLAVGEGVPRDLFIGWTSDMLTRDLVWVAIYNGEIIGILIAFAAHQTFFPVRIVGRPGNPRYWLLKMFRHVAREVRDRGYKGATAVLDANEIGASLFRIANRRGGVALTGDSGRGWVALPFDSWLKNRPVASVVI